MFNLFRSRQPSFADTLPQAIPTPTNPETLPLSAKEIESRITANRILSGSALYDATLLPEAGYDELIHADDLTGYTLWSRP